MLANLRPLVDAQGVAFDDSQAGKGSFKLGKGGEAPPVPLDRDDIGSGIEQGPGQAAGPGAYLIDRLSFQWTRNGGDTRQQLAVEDEILPERLARLKPMAGDDLAERLGFRSHASDLWAAHSAARRIADAIARGSARSSPAMSKAVP